MTITVDSRSNVTYLFDALHVYFIVIWSLTALFRLVAMRLAREYACDVHLQTIPC